MNRFKRAAYHLVCWIFVSVGSIFLMVGSVLLIVSAIAYLEIFIFLAKAESVQGTIIELVPKPNDRLEYHFLNVAFREETTKRSIEFISSLSFSSKAYNEDEKIKVFYDPENPEDAKIGDSQELFLWQLIMLIPGLFLFVTGFYLTKERRRIRREKKM